jgi:hypothetical protein
MYAMPPSEGGKNAVVAFPPSLSVCDWLPSSDSSFLSICYQGVLQASHGHVWDMYPYAIICSAWVQGQTEWRKRRRRDKHNGRGRP